MKTSSRFDVRVLVVVASLLLSLISGLGQLVGFFGRASIPTAVSSLALAVVILLLFPQLLKKRVQGKGAFSRYTPNQIARGTAILVALIGLAPFIGKLALAMQAHRSGMRSMELDYNALAQPQLSRSARYFENLGFLRQALRSKIALIQVEAGLGETGRAETLIREIETNDALDTEAQGKLYIVRARLAYDQGQLEQAARYFALAHQAVKPGTRDEAVLLQGEGVLLAETDPTSTGRVWNNYRRAESTYRRLDDELGLAQISLNEANLVTDPVLVLARYDTALSHAHKLGNESLTGRTEFNIARALRDQSRFVEAQQHFDSAGEHFRKVADFLSLADLELSESLLESSRGRNEAARQHLSRARANFQTATNAQGESKDRRRLARLIVQEGSILDDLGQSQEAEKRYEEALVVYATAPDLPAEISLLIDMSALQLRQNHNEDASASLRRAREMMRLAKMEGAEAGAMHNNLGIASQQIGDFENARAEFTISLQLLTAARDRLRAAEALENIAILDVIQSKDDSVSARIERVLAVYDSLSHYDRQAKTLFNLFQVYSSRGDRRAGKYLDRMFDLMKEQQVDHETESNVLLNIYPKDLAKAKVIVLRERVRALRDFYAARHEDVGLGRSLLQLARVEQRLGNSRQVHDYAVQAAPFADAIPLPLRINYHSDLGFFLMADDPAGGLDHFWKAFDLLEGTDESLRISTLQVIGAQLPLVSGTLRNAQREKLRAVAQSTDSATSNLARRLLASLH